MRSVPIFLLKCFLAFLSIQVIGKILFFGYQFFYGNNLDLFLFFKAIFNGIRHDIAIASYMIVPIILLLAVRQLIVFNDYSIIKGYFTFIAIVVVCIFTIDFEMFRSWGFHIDNSFFKYLNSPKEVIATINSGPIVVPLFLGLVFVSYAYWVRRLIFIEMESFISNQSIYYFLGYLLFLGSLIIPIRGGLQLAPLNQSSVYFSKISLANQVALNPVFNFFQSLSKIKVTTNPFNYYNKNELDSLLKPIYANINNTKIVTNTIQNVLIITWESFTAKVIGTTENGKPIVLNFEKWAQKGIYFNNCYATGDRSEKGLIGILSGYPAQPITSIMTEPSKTAKLPSITKTLNNKGYSTAWYYGGEPEFANIKSYILNSGFDKIITKADFNDLETKSSKWGANDEKVFGRLLNDLDTQKQPFFINYFTLSSHEPFEVGNYHQIKGDTETLKFENSLHYTDFQLNKFLETAQNKPWWKNTLIIIVADHGHRLPEIGNKKDAFHIPMLWLGGVISKPQIVNKVTSQIDIPAMLFGQMGIKTDFKFSKDIFNLKTKSWAYGAFNNGFVWVDEAGYQIHDNVGQQFLVKTNQDSLSGKVFLQWSFEDYLSK